MVYPFFIGRRTGMNVVNMAVSGMTMAQHTERPSTHSFVPYLYQNVPADADYITIKFGIMMKIILLLLEILTIQIFQHFMVHGILACLTI